jgi:hypothetical protein
MEEHIADAILFNALIKFDKQDHRSLAIDDLFVHIFVLYYLIFVRKSY